VTESCSQK